MDPIKIINKYYGKDSRTRDILIDHSKKVTKKALTIAKKSRKFNPDIVFIKEAAMLHDIGIFLTYAPLIECFGSLSYICHGYLGREILEKEGFLRHGLVCERHIGMGISVEEIKTKKLPLPARNMIPITIEEEIISLADKFYSKTLKKEENINKIKKELEGYGWGHAERFQNLIKKFYE